MEFDRYSDTEPVDRAKLVRQLALVERLQADHAEYWGAPDHMVAAARRYLTALGIDIIKPKTRPVSDLPSQAKL